jgi:exonuclease I
LGAARDVTSTEKKMLKTVCDHQHKIPFVKIRFGTVPEFTSKILSILTYHHSQNNIVMVGAIERLLQTKVDQKESALLQEAQIRSHSCLHVVCTVPLLSNQISIDLEARDRVHWCIVRVIV